MRATLFEFRHRFWLIAGIFAAGFASYVLDHHNVADALVGRRPGGVRMALAAAALLVVAAAALRTWASAFLRTSVVKDTTIHADRLVADGPYRYVRNPLYLGTFLLTVAFAVLASRLGFVVMVGGMLVFLLRLIGREEYELSQAQSESYAAYRAAVPALVPALGPRVPASGARPAWGQALAGELMMWAFALGTAWFAATLDQRVFYVFLILGFVGYLPGKRRR